MKPLRLLSIAASLALAACGTSPTAVTRTPPRLHADETPPPPPPPTEERGGNGFGSGN